ncbi:lysine-specific histone demethylase 1 homolog 1-like [Macadamia integrifolia]|uniref:lysine-specific histone demethylase 1 homolog 1-like n=1 Tax=Macadamia integrifolia TaxID=60698 RepID=UPI001C4E577D|nr:lysine-specific histone demethylase 1 homolog 1-like [Macadamia integrifolia]
MLNERQQFEPHAPSTAMEAEPPSLPVELPCNATADGPSPLNHIPPPPNAPGNHLPDPQTTLVSHVPVPHPHPPNTRVPSENHLPVPQSAPENQIPPRDDCASESQSAGENHLPRAQVPLDDHLAESLIEKHVDDTSKRPLEDHIDVIPNHAPEENPPTGKKRRRRKKQFPEMVPSATAVDGLRVLRPLVKSSIYDEKMMDEIIQMQINDNPAPSKNRRRKIGDIAKEIDIEALIAISVGFPVDSLTEEEIESNVVSTLGGVEQANYVVVRNHILTRWRSNVSAWMTRDHALESIRSEHRGLVNSAYSFLLEHGYINFGLAPAIAEVHLKPHVGPEKANIIIVGAGLAGLAAARHLIYLGFKVVILEGRKRPGGRVRTRKMSGEGVVAAADLGGSVITGINGNPLGVLARQLGFPLHKVRDICPLYLPDGMTVNAEMDSRVEVSFNQLLDKVCKLREAVMDEVESVDVSLGTSLEAFRQVYKVGEDPQERMLLNWHLANLEYANASPLSDLSMAYWDQDDPYEMGGDHCFIPGGNGRFIRALAENTPIFYNRTVESIRYGLDGVMVYAGGQVFRGDMALCTVPLGVLKKGSIEFVPELPQPKKDCIQRLGFGLLNKVTMLFPYDFWGGGIDTFGHLTDDESMRGQFFLFYSYSSVSGGPLLVALVAGESAIKFEMMSPVDAIGRVLDILRRIFTRKGIDVPNPVQVVCTRWGKDRFTYGSYSYVAVGASGDDYDVLAESVGDGRVFFAGEATNRRYPATMHGAFLSGLREAANILRVANKRSLVLQEKTNIVREVSGDLATMKLLVPLEKTDNAGEKTNIVGEDGGDLATMKPLVPLEKTDNAREEGEDLDELFANPDLSFGSFSVLFDPRSVDLDSISLLRVGFGGEKLVSVSVSLFLYGLISRKQVLELSAVDGDSNRVRLLNRSFGVRLAGRKALAHVGESLIDCIKSVRANLNRGGTNEAHHE